MSEIFLETLCFFLDRAPLCESSLLHHAGLFAVRDLFLRNVVVIFLSKIFLVLFLCCLCGVEIVFCVCVSVVAPSCCQEDGSLAWFEPLEILLWSPFCFFLLELRLHTPCIFSTSPFNTDFSACSVRRKRRGNCLAVIFCDLPFHFLCPLFPVTWEIHPKPKTCTHEF